MFSIGRLGRLFYRSPKGTQNIVEGEDYQVDRKLTTNGTSFHVSIAPITVKELGLKEGVTVKKKGNKLIITRRKK